MSNGVRAEVLRVSRSRTGWRDATATGASVGGTNNQKSSQRPYISSLKSTFEGGGGGAHDKQQPAPRADPSSKMAPANASGIPATGGRSESQDEGSTTRGSSRAPTKVSTIANMFQSLTPAKHGEPETTTGTFLVARSGATMKPESPRADHANRKTVSSDMPPPSTETVSHQSAARTRSGGSDRERRDSIPSSQESSSAVSPGGGGGGSVHLNRTESHLARFNNARAMFERLEEQSLRKPVRGGSSSSSSGGVPGSSSSKKRSGSVSPSRASPIRSVFSPTHQHHHQHHARTTQQPYGAGSISSRSPSPGLTGLGAETQSVGSSPQHQSPLSPRDKSRSADCILQDSATHHAHQPPFYQPQQRHQQQQPHYSSQVNGRHHPSSLDLDLHEYGAGEAIVSPGPLSPRLASYLESSPSSSDENQPPQHSIRTNGTDRTQLRLGSSSSEDVVDDEDREEEEEEERLSPSPTSNDESSAAKCKSPSGATTKPTPLSPKPTVAETGIHRSAPVASSRGGVGRFKRESPPGGPVAASSAASCTSPRSSPGSTSRSAASRSSSSAPGGSTVASTLSTHQRPRIVSSTPATAISSSSSKMADDRNKAHAPQKETTASVPSGAGQVLTKRSGPGKIEAVLLNGNQAESKSNSERVPTLLSSTPSTVQTPGIDKPASRLASSDLASPQQQAESADIVPSSEQPQQRTLRQHDGQPLPKDTKRSSSQTESHQPPSNGHRVLPRTDLSPSLDDTVTSGVLTAPARRSDADTVTSRGGERRDDTRQQHMTPLGRLADLNLLQESPVDPESGSAPANGMPYGDEAVPQIALADLIDLEEEEETTPATESRSSPMPPRPDSSGSGSVPLVLMSGPPVAPDFVAGPPRASASASARRQTSSADDAALLLLPLSSSNAKATPVLGSPSSKESDRANRESSSSEEHLVIDQAPSPSAEDSVNRTKDDDVSVTNQGTSPLSPPWVDKSLPNKKDSKDEVRVNGNAYPEEVQISQPIRNTSDGTPFEEPDFMTSAEAKKLLSSQEIQSDEEAMETTEEGDDADGNATSDESPLADAIPSLQANIPATPSGGREGRERVAPAEEGDEEDSEGPFEEEETEGNESGEYVLEEGVNYLEDGHFWVEIPGLPDHEEEDAVASYSVMTVPKKRDRVKFSTQPIRVYSTFSVADYDRRNDDVDPVSASAEYELEKRVEKMDVFPVELLKGLEGLGLSIIGMGVGADAGLEKLGIFVKTITEGGAAHRDGRINVNDQIIEVDGKSLVGVTQAYAASVLRNTSGLVRFLIGREKDGENSEVAQLIYQSLQADRERDERRKVLEHGQQFQQGDGEPRSDAYPGLTLPIPSLAVQVPTAPQVMVQEDATPEEGEDGPTCEVFDLEEDSSESPSPDSDVTTLRIKLKEAQYKSAVGEAELAKTKTKVAMLESRQSDHDEFERHMQMLNGRLSDSDRVREGMKKEVMAYQDMLEESQGQYILLEKKYYKAKKLIKEFQQREQDLIHREEYHLQQLQEKDQEYNSLVKLLKDRVIQLEQDLTETQKTAGLPVRLPYDNSSIKPLQLTPQQLRKPQVVSQRQTASKDLEGDMSDSELSDSDLGKYDISPDSDDTENKTSTVERKPPPSKADLFEKAVPQTELLDSTAAKSKAELASKGSLANRQPPSLKKTGSTGSSGDGTSFDHRDSDSSLGSSREDLDEFTEPSLGDKTSTSTSMSSDSSPAVTPLPSLDIAASPQKTVQPNQNSCSGTPVTEPLQQSPRNIGHLHPAAAQQRKANKPNQATDCRGSPVKIDGRFAEEMRLILERKNIEARKQATDDFEAPYPQSYTTDDHPNLPLSSGSSATSPHSPGSVTSNASDAGGVLSSPRRSLDVGSHRKAKRGSSSSCSRLNPQTETSSRGSPLSCCCCLPGSATQTADSVGIGDLIPRDDFDMEGQGEEGGRYLKATQTQQPQSLFGDQDSGIGIATYPSSFPERRAYQWHSCPVPEWSTGQVGQWLLALSMEQYITAFVDGNVSGQELINMDGAKLRSFGVSNSADRSLLKKKIKDLRGVVEKERKAAEKEHRTREKLIRKAEKAAEKAASRKNDVVKAVRRTQGIYQRWCELFEDISAVPKEELDWVTNELRNSLRSIEWDLEDLEETITIVEKNPKKFKIEDGEIATRRQFIYHTRQDVQSIKDKMNASKGREKERRQPLLGTNPISLQGGYTRLHNDLESPNHKFIENNVQQQQMIVRAQDDQLDLIQDSMGTLKTMTSQIGQELDEQAIMLDEFSHEVETTESKLDHAVKKVAKVLHMSNDRRQWIAIFVLLSILVVVIILLCVL